MLLKFYGFLSFSLSEWVDSVPRRRLLAAAEFSAPFNCTPAAILDFPADPFTDWERRHGAAFCHALLAIYLFVLLAVVCDEYFVPAIEQTIDGMSTKLRLTSIPC